MLKNCKSDLNKEKIKQARYVLLKGKLPPESPQFELYKNVYKLWTETWKKTFGDVGSFEAFSPDEFYRQDIIPVIAYKDEPIAAHFYSLFHLDNPAAMDHHYFEIFSKGSIQELRKSNRKLLMSLEYLTVNPEYRKSQSGVSFAEMLISLGCLVLREIGYDAALGVAVKAAKVDKMAFKLGFDLLDDNACRGNLVCDIVVRYLETIDNSLHPEIDVDRYMKQLWETKEFAFDIFEKIAA